MPIAFPIFLATLVLVIRQPRGLGIGWSASGAFVAVIITSLLLGAALAALRLG